MGPASNSVEMLKKLFEAGLNICRVNMSHGTYEGHGQTIKNIRQASKELGREVGILLDLQGPKIRVDKLPAPLQLKNGDQWYIGESALGAKYTKNFIPTIYKKLASDCSVNQRVLFDDGLIQGMIKEKGDGVIKVEITVGGELKSNKGINLPDTQVTAPSFTEKDREDLEFGLTQDIDFIALSFVRTAKDILDVKNMLKERGFDLPIISKIEKPQAIDNIEEILTVTDGIMVARGDMAVEVGNHLVPSIQKMLIRRCNQLGLPIITATQMLESMINNPSPTRAEASDVANAVWDGTDAVMLSAECATGTYPLETVTMMDKICEEAEKTQSDSTKLRNAETHAISNSLMAAAATVAEKIEAKRILVVTNTGASAQQIARFKPSVKVLGITDNVKTMRRMSWLWGVSPFVVKNYNQDAANASILKDVIGLAKEECKLKSGDKVVIVMGDEKFFKTGSANTVKIDVVP